MSQNVSLPFRCSAAMTSHGWNHKRLGSLFFQLFNGRTGECRNLIHPTTSYSDGDTHSRFDEVQLAGFSQRLPQGFGHIRYFVSVEFLADFDHPGQGYIFYQLFDNIHESPFFTVFSISLF